MNRSRPGLAVEFLFLATVFTVSFAKLQWEVAGTLSLSDVLTGIFLVAWVGTRVGTGDRRLAWGAAVAGLFFVGFLAVVPPDGAAAELIRETGAGVVAPPDDVEAIKAALAELHARFANGGLGSTEIPEETRYRLSRRARAEELAELVRSL